MDGTSTYQLAPTFYASSSSLLLCDKHIIQCRQISSFYSFLLITSNYTKQNQSTMKAVSVLLSLAAASVVHAADDAAAGSIRTTRKAEVGDVKVQYEAGGKRRERKALTDQHKQMRNDAFDRHLNKKDAPESDVATDKEKETESGDRKLYKAKTGLGKLMQDDDAMRAGKTPINRPGDNWGPEYRDDGRSPCTIVNSNFKRL